MWWQMKWGMLTVWWGVRDTCRNVYWQVFRGVPAPLRFDELNFLFRQLKEQARK